MKREEITEKGGERERGKKGLHGNEWTPTRVLSTILAATGREIRPVRQMQPYVVAVLINAAANPLGVDSFILFFPSSSSSSSSSSVRFFRRSIGRLYFPPTWRLAFLPLLFLISLANSSWITPDRIPPEQGLSKHEKTAGKCEKYAEEREVCREDRDGRYDDDDDEKATPTFLYLRREKLKNEKLLRTATNFKNGNCIIRI